jgi:hypothetical protein
LSDFHSDDGSATTNDPNRFDSPLWPGGASNGYPLTLFGEEDYKYMNNRENAGALYKGD